MILGLLRPDKGSIQLFEQRARDGHTAALRRIRFVGGSTSLYLHLTGRENLEVHHFVFWGLLILPLSITVETSLAAGIDHSDNQWKALLARPVPRYAVYLSKLIDLVALTLIRASIHVAGVIASGLLLPYLQQTATFTTPVPHCASQSKGFR
jgi:ABC-type Fe3+/spermidine/putrescine transport system ATPase subunit